MAAPTVIGKTGELIEQPGSPQKMTTDTGRNITRTFVFAGSGEPELPTILDVYDGLVLKEINDQTNTAGGKRTITLNYGEKYSEIVSVAYSKLLETETEFDSNMISLPIEQHPNYEESWKDSKPGVQDFLNPQPVRRDTDYLTVLYNDLYGVGRTGQGGLSHNWLYTGMVCRKIGIARSPISGYLYTVYQRVRTYQFASNGWDADIYR
jgi:hypothetical protein